jgi:regulator of replication initiation timing
VLKQEHAVLQQKYSDVLKLNINLQLEVSNLKKSAELEINQDAVDKPEYTKIGQVSKPFYFKFLIPFNEFLYY